MKKATKGALAVTAAGALLLGGAGTLAYWNDVQGVTGGTISSGHLKLTPGTCDGWKLNNGQHGRSRTTLAEDRARRLGDPDLHLHGRRQGHEPQGEDRCREAPLSAAVTRVCWTS